jgi:hypothetical protein
MSKMRNPRNLPEEILLKIAKYLPTDLHGTDIVLQEWLNIASPILLRDFNRMGRDLVFRDREFSLRQVAQVLCDYLKFPDLPEKTCTLRVHGRSEMPGRPSWWDFDRMCKQEIIKLNLDRRLHEAFLRDLIAGDRRAMFILILCKLKRLQHLHLHGQSLDNFPFLVNLFSVPHLPIENKPPGMNSDRSLPLHWKQEYYTVALQSLAPQLETLELPDHWRIECEAEGSSVPMPPVASLSMFVELRHLSVPCQALIPLVRSWYLVHGTLLLKVDQLPKTLTCLRIKRVAEWQPLAEWLEELWSNAHRPPLLTKIEIEFIKPGDKQQFDALRPLAGEVGVDLVAEDAKLLWGTMRSVLD